MGTGFRQSMTWLHTWAGVVVGGLLLAIFWMGTLSVFDREIDRWMMPATRLAAPAEPVSVDALLPVVRDAAGGSPHWSLRLPSAREPALRLFYDDGAGTRESVFIDAETRTAIAAPGTLGGTGFIFPFHFKLHLGWRDVGYWLVGLAGMAMLVLLVSGVVIHRRLFADFFTFRPGRRLPRSVLDLHNLTGVVALPFHFVIALSGLIIFVNIYFPQAPSLAYAHADSPVDAYLEEGRGRYGRAAAGTPGALASLDAMLAEAERLWSGGKPFFVRVWHPGDANGYVEVRRSYADMVTMNFDQLYFDAATGALLHRFGAAPVMSAQRFIAGLHFIQFEHWTLRWLYFIAGLAGCVMIGTGFLFWLEARRKRLAVQGQAGLRIVEGVAAGSVTGIVLATLGFFVANRMLPAGAEFAGAPRELVEMRVFYALWGASFIHAWLRPRQAWREQCRAIAGLALVAVVLNALTTGDHPVAAIATGRWAVAGMDLMLLAATAVALVAAQRLERAERVRAARPAVGAAAPLPADVRRA